MAARYAAVVATGRSDFPNQINNVLAFPGVFRGALDARATRVTEGMKVAAAEAIAEVVADDLRAGRDRAVRRSTRGSPRRWRRRSPGRRDGADGRGPLAGFAGARSCGAATHVHGAGPAGHHRLSRPAGVVRAVACGCMRAAYALAV